MFVAFMAVVILATVPLAGGRLARLGRLRLKGVWLIGAALLVQIAITGIVEGWPHGVLVALHLASYALIGVAIWRNRRVPGLLVIALGGFLNGAVIALNDGTLPASARALAEAGAAPQKHFTNSGVLAHPVLPQLGDIVATPSWLPFRNVISIGDVIALIGVAILAHVASESLAARWLAATPVLRSIRSRGVRDGHGGRARRDRPAGHTHAAAPRSALGGRLQRG